MAERVRRFTTRAPRNDDDAKLVVHVEHIAPERNSFVYEGWGDTRYCIQSSDMIAIRAKLKSPLVELGDPTDAIRFRMQFAPAKIVCLWRDMNVEGLEKLFGTRNISEEQKKLRLESLEEDILRLRISSNNYDFVIQNNSSADALFESWREILKQLNVPAIEN
ncbi:MAG TPA: hypothetical protein VFW05_00750 [Verrucomicrobiae bacterium]|nr:hypothetical protein [Verrucomicrobiae bacterium]